MSTAKQAVAPKSVLDCGNCGYSNVEEAKFCGGCGKPVFEPCANCKTSVRLTQKFCGECGADLESILGKRIADFKQSLADTLLAAKEHRYDVAIERLKSLSQNADYRFAALAQHAQQALPKITKLRDDVQQRFQESQAVALAAFERGEHERVVDLLGNLPPKLLSEEAVSALAKSNAFVKEVSELNDSLRASLEKKEWGLAGSLLGRLMAIFPEEANFRRLAEKVSAKLTSSAERLFEKCDYSQALARLDAVPTEFQNDAYLAMKHKIATIEWLSKQFTLEPFATPVLAKLADRMKTESPNDTIGRQMAEKISVKLKAPQTDASVVFPTWDATRESVLGGGNADIFGWPQTIDCSGQSTIQQHPARFGVAFGLALQALNASCFSLGFTEKKSLFAKISTKKSASPGWGIDVGTSSVKAVQLRKDGDKVIAVNSFIAEYPEIARSGRDNKAFLAMREVLKEMVAKLSLTGADCWVNYPARDILARFVELPPVDNKKAAALLDKEVVGQFPVSIEELDVLKWFADKPEREGLGRPAAMISARKFLTKQRLSFLTEVGLSPAGMQCEPIALMNLLWHDQKAVLETEDQSTTDIPAIAIVDAGASSTTLSVLAARRLWFRTIDGGGEDLTLALARSAKVVRDEAERLKKVPHELLLPASQFQPVEEKQEAIRHRMKQIIGEMSRDNREVKVAKTLVTGGSSLCFGWMRNAICSR